MDGTNQILSLAQLQQMQQPNAQRVLSLEELQEKRATQEVEDNTFSPLLSAGLGFANASSFGLFSQTLSKSGLVEQEKLRALRDVNPISYTAGEIASFLIPGTGVAKGGGLVAKSLRAANSPIQQVAKAGNAVNALTQAQLARVVGGTKAGDIVSKIIGTGLGSAVEGAAYATQQFISDEAMGDPDANAETFLSRISTGAAVAGGIGAGLTSLGQGFKIAAENYKKSARGAFKTISGLDDEVIEEVASDKGYQRIRDLMKEPGENAEKIKEYALQKFKAFGDKRKNWFDQFDEASKSAVNDLNMTMQPFKLSDILDDLKSVKQSVSIGKFAPTAERKAAERVLRELDDYEEIITKAAFDNAEKFGLASLIKQDLKKFRGLSAKQKQELLNKEFKSKALQDELFLKPSDLNDIRISMNQVAKARNVYNPLQATKPGGEEFALLGNKIREKLYGRAPEKSAFALLNKEYGKQAQAFEELKGFKIKDFNLEKLGSEDAVTKLIAGRSARAQEARKFLQDLDDVFGTDLADTQKFLNAYDKVTQSKLAPILTGYSQMVPALGAMFGLSVGLSPAAAGAFYLAGAAAQAPILRAPIIRGATKLSKAIDEGITLKTAAGKKVPPGLVPFLAAKIAAMGQIERELQSAKAPFEKTNEIIIQENVPEFKDLRKFKETPEDIYKLYSDPQYFEEQFNKNNAELIFAYPAMVEPLKNKLYKQVEYLAQTLPKEEPGRFIFDGPKPVSDLQKQEFERRADVIEDPRHILNSLKNNSLTSDAVSVFKVFYPNLYQQVVRKIFDLAPEDVSKLNYDQKQQVSILLGQPMTNALDPQRFIALQKNFMAQNQDIQQPSNNDLKGGDQIVQDTYSAGQKVQEN